MGTRAALKPMDCLQGGQFQPFFPDVCTVLTTNHLPEKGWPAAGCVWLEVKLTAASWVTPSICDSPASAGWSWRSPITTGPVQVPLGTLHLPPEGLDDLLSFAVVSQLIMLIIVIACVVTGIQITRCPIKTASKVKHGRLFLCNAHYSMNLHFQDALPLPD